MEYRNLGQSGLRVSAVSIGGWLTIGGSLQGSTSADILRRAIELGINFIDLADIYAKGEAERVAGEVLQDYRRSDLVISSKVFWPMSENPNDRGLSRKHIFESVDASLKRLRTDYLDIYFCHRFDPSTPLEETVRAMDDLVRAGKILYWGTSVWGGNQLRLAHQIADRRNAHPPVVEQPRYNLLDRSIETGVVPAALQMGMGLVVWSPLAQGLLTGKYDQGVPAGSRGETSSWLDEHLNDETIARCRRFSALSEEIGATPGQVALAWALNKPGISSVITGATRVSHVESNVKAATLALDREAMAAIEDIFPEDDES